MSAESAISWLARTVDGKTWHQGHTLNPWSGCYVKSDGCRECYAKNLPPAMRRGAVWGKNEPRVLAPDSYLAQVHAWNRAAEKLGIRMPVFCASTADIFERHAVPEENERLNGQRAKVWALVAATPWLDWLFLTKEPENILDMIPAEWAANGCPVNVWMGCTVENQKAADARIPHLLRVPAVVRFLSVEPMVGAVDLRDVAGLGCGHEGCIGQRIDALTGADQCGHGYWGGSRPERIHWVLCGGESGRGVNVRPMAPEWARSLRDQCVAAGVAFHFKQWGEWAPWVNEAHFTHCGEEAHPHAWIDAETGASGHAWIVDDDGLWSNWTGEPRRSDDGSRLHEAIAILGRHGKKATGRILDGRTWDELPEVTRG